MFQVSDPHEGFVEVVQLQNTGQQEKARNQNTGEEFWQSKRLQTDSFQSAGWRKGGERGDSIS